MVTQAAAPVEPGVAAARPLGFDANLNGYYDASLNLSRAIAERTTRLTVERDDRRARVNTPEALAAEQEAITRAVRDGIGGLVEYPDAVRYELHGTLYEDTFAIERILYESAPHVVVTANLYRPAGSAPGTRAAVFVACGHSDDAKADTQYQHVARRLAANGFVVLVIDPIGQGERHSYVQPNGTSSVAWGTAEHTYAGIQCWWGGRSIARYLLRDAEAGISLLAALPEVDPTRIGVTGNSGGGLLTTMLMALDPRVAAAAPGTFVSGREIYQHSGQRQDAEQILLGGTTAGVDHADLLLTMAPRPVLVLAAEYDFFPIEATRKTVASVNSVLEACGQEPVRLFSVPTLHRYDDAMATEALQFFAEALSPGIGLADGSAPTAAVDTSSGTPSGRSTAELQVTRRGQILLDRPDSETVFDSERRHAAMDVPDEDSVFIDWLDARVRGARRPSPAAFPRWFDAKAYDHLTARAGYWYTEDQIIVAGVIVHAAAGGPAPELHVVLDDGGTTALTTSSPWLDLVADGADVLVLDVRGHGALAPHDREQRDPLDINSAGYKLACDLLWLDDSLQAARAYDLLDTLRLVRNGLLPDSSPARIIVHGSGAAGFSAVIATLLDPKIAALELRDVVDPFQEVSVRINNTLMGAWQCVIPGFTRHADAALVGRLLAPRLLAQRDGAEPLHGADGSQRARRR
jgi:cephalosporin-C deacetylase-like acetyl esterase